MDIIRLSFDVGGGLPRDVTAGARLTIAAWLFVPPNLPPKTPNVITLLHGGSYDKRYFHIQIPGRPGYSAAEYLSKAGNIVVLFDLPGVGESSRADNQSMVTRHVAARALHVATLELYDRLKKGEVSSSLRPVEDFRRIGGGHSMGGMILITQQAEHRSYDAIMMLGQTAIGADLEEAAVAAVDHGPVGGQSPDYILVDRHPLRRLFHWDGVDEAVLAADDELLVEAPYMMVTQSRQFGILAEDAARVDVPIFLCFGERDVSPDPHAEPGCYRGSGDVTLQILSRSAHCHNFAETRHQLWERMHRWANSLVF